MLHFFQKDFLLITQEILMKIYTLKATKSRSNPQMVREFQIDGRRPVTDLLAILDLLFGSNISQYAVFTQREQIFNDLSVPIENVFTISSHFYVRL